MEIYEWRRKKRRRASAESIVRCIPLFLFLAALIPRALDLDVFLTYDEQFWRDLLPSFLTALHNKDWAATYQAPYGVTVMWTLAAGLYGSYLMYGSVLAGGGQANLNDWQGFFTKVLTDPSDIHLLFMERLPFALVLSISVVLFYFLLKKLFGCKVAFLGTILFSFDPLYLAYSRLILPDAQVSSFMILSCLAFLAYLKHSHRLRYLVLSGCSAGLAFLAKWPSLSLVPLVGFMIVVVFFSAVRERGIRAAKKIVGQLGLVLFVWAGIAALIFAALWPAMWVDPRGTMHKLWIAIIRVSPTSAVVSPKPDFFLGKVTPTHDPGPFFYPVAILARLTPLTLVGLLLLGFLLLRDWVRNPKRLEWKAEIASLAVYVCFFGGLMSLGLSKGVRYVLPLFPALEVLAGLGWYSFMELLGGVWGIKARKSPGIWVGASAFILILQAGFSLPYSPYYLTYYNPLLGGGQQAVNLIQVGVGEGIDEAARYLNRKENPASLRVAATDGSDLTFAPFFAGKRLPLTRQRLFWNDIDYAVVYIGQAQRLLIDTEVMRYLSSLKPEHIVRISGIDYAWIYEIDKPLPTSFRPFQHAQGVRFGDQILLFGYDVDNRHVRRDGKLRVNLYWQVLREMKEDCTIYLKLVNDAYKIWGQQDSRPVWDGSPTNSWEQGQVVGDKREIEVLPGTPPGLYRIEVILLDLRSGRTLESEGEESVLLGPIEVPWREPPSIDNLDIENSLEMNLGNKVQLLGYNIESGFRPGDNIHLTLFWQCLDDMAQSYTVFIHLVDARGNIVAQKDNPPVDGFYATTKWEVGEIVRDQYDLIIPEDVASGEYRVKAGMYLLETGERLRAMRGDEPLPENVVALPPFQVHH